MLFAVALAAAQTMTIHVTDPLVDAVAVTCAGVTQIVPVANGAAAAPARGGGCAVQMVRGRGAVSGAGRFVCNEDGCVPAAPPQPVTVVDAPGRLNVVFTTDLAGARELELDCGGERVRAPIIGQVAAIDGLTPGAFCQPQTLGGASVWATPIATDARGTLTCGVDRGRLICAG